MDGWMNERVNDWRSEGIKDTRLCMITWVCAVSSLFITMDTHLCRSHHCCLHSTSHFQAGYFWWSFKSIMIWNIARQEAICFVMYTRQCLTRGRNYTSMWGRLNGCTLDNWRKGKMLLWSTGKEEINNKVRERFQRSRKRRKETLRLGDWRRNLERTEGLLCGCVLTAPKISSFEPPSKLGT